MHRLTIADALKLAIPIGLGVVVNLAFLLAVNAQGLAAQHVIGMSVTNIGLLIWFIARLQLGLTAPKPKLVTGGLYRKFRHPVYYAALLCMVGICIFVFKYYVAPAMITGIALQGVRITKEEVFLKQQYGQAYADYKRQTWF